MRACEGCRRRKIKCDAATTNQWPCAACVRLKLHCVPPTVNYDRTHMGSGHLSGLERVLDFDNSSGSGDDDYTNVSGGPPTFELQVPPQQMHIPQAPYSAGLPPFNTPPYSDRAMSQHEFAYDDISSMAVQVPDPLYRDHTAFNPPHSAPLQSTERPWNPDQYSAGELSDVLGWLKIHENGVGMCLTRWIYLVITNKLKFILHSSIYLCTEQKPRGSARCRGNRGQATDYYFQLWF